MAVLITGASAGFGAAMARQFAAAGIAVIGAARRSERLDELKQQLGDLFHPLAMDVRSKESVDAALSSLAEAPEAFRRIDCLINNAGLALDLSPAHQADFADWENMIATNITGLAYLTRQVLPEMVARGEGYVINIGSIAGSYPYPGSNVYGATKAFVHQFSLNLRADLHGSGVRVSNIEPGLCGGTEFSQVRFKGDEARAAAVYESVQALAPEDVAAAALWLYQTPKHVNVNYLEMMPVSQSFDRHPVYRPAPEPAAAEDKQAAKPAPKRGFFSRLFGG